MFSLLKCCIASSQRCLSCSFFPLSHFTAERNVLMTFNYIVKIRAKDAVILLFSKAINSIDWKHFFVRTFAQFMWAKATATAKRIWLWSLFFMCLVFISFIFCCVVFTSTQSGTFTMTCARLSNIITPERMCPLPQKSAIKSGLSWNEKKQ